MREINRYNYEEFFLDYLEGNLNNSELKTLEEFLAQDPDLKKEFEEISLVKIKQENHSVDKTTLKEIPFQLDFDHFCIAKLEGDLNDTEEKNFNQYLSSDKTKAEEFNLYLKTKLRADQKLTYPDKEKLKKKERKLISYWVLSGVSIAASVLLLFSVWNTISVKPDIENKKKQVTAAIDSSQKSRENKKPETVISKNQIAVNSEIPVAVKKIKQAVRSEKQIHSKVKKIEPAVRKKLEKIDLPEITPEFKLLENARLAETPIITNAKSVSQIHPSNSGLANLGLSWKSSIPEKKKNNSLLYAVAKMGVDKLGEIAGKNIQLEKKYDSKTEKTKINFNTSGLGFSTTVK